MSDLAIELVDVTKRFGRQTAVDQLNLRVPRGAIYGFIGPNGSGKTTTLRMILRILQPDHGVVRVLGRDRAAAADDRLGYLPEERGLYKRMRVLDLLLYFARLKGKRQARPAIVQWLRRLDAEAWQQKRIDGLSKGMAQKIQFIAAVVADPELVILDEPFSGLDPVNLEVLREAVLSLRERGATVVFSTHDMDVAERLCDTIFMIFRGRKVLDGSMEEIQRRYPANRIRVQLENGADPPPSLPHVHDLRRVGRFFEMTVADDGAPQQVLRQLVDRVAITHFEIVRPSLHDIFVHIARPGGSGDAAAS